MKMSVLLSLPTDSRRFYLALGCIILTAWGILIALQRSAYAGLASHEAIEHNGYALSLRLAAFLLSWVLMTVAMMLPGSLPQLKDYVQPFRHRTESSRLVGLLILGYLAPWILFGMLAYSGDIFLHRIAAPTAPLAAISGMIPPAIVLIAGLYQFTPGKRSTLARCRLSQAPFQKSCAVNLNRSGALRQGLKLGAFCVGSCWSLMLLMFAVGHNRLDWMIVLTGIMASERLAPWGQRLAWLVGLALIVWATFLIITMPHSGHSH